MKARKALIVGGILLFVAILIPIIHHFHLRAVANAYIAELKADGEPMDLEQVLPPSIPPNQNSADTVRKAVALFKADSGLLSTNFYFGGMKMVAPGKAIVCSQLPDVRDDSETNSWEEVAAAVAHDSQPFGMLQQIVEKRTFNFGVDYQQGLTDLTYSNFYMAEMKAAAMRLQAATLCDLHRGDVVSAVRRVRAMLAIVDGMSEERLAISELVRIAIAHITLAANWEVLQSTNLTDEQLAELQNDWANIDFVRAQENALNMERTGGQLSLKKWRDSGPGLEHYISQYSSVWQALGGDQPKHRFFDPIILKSRIYRWRYWWSYPDEVRALKGFQILLAAPRSAQTNDSWLPIEKELESEVDKLSIPTNSQDFWFVNAEESDMHYILSGSILSLSRVFNRVIKAEAARQMVIAAIALKRYQLRHGSYPSDLNALVPEFLQKVPRDPIEGQPLKYRLNTNGMFLLYSIGDDGKDDGGDTTPTGSSHSLIWYSGRDWVWPQPATPEEIQNFYQNPAK